MNGFPISRLLIPDFDLFRVRRQRMVRSFSDRYDTGTVYDRFFNKCARIEDGARHTVAEIDGPGLVSRLYFTLPVRYRRFLLRDLILRIYYDGADHASVAAPLGDFFGLPFGRYTGFSTFFLSCTSGGYVCRFPLPFGKSIRIELANESGRAAYLIFYQVSYYELQALPASCPYFMASWRRENPTRQGLPYVILDREGAGWYVGCNMQVQSRENFLLKRWRDIPFPQGWGLGTLEGWERIFIDSETEPSFHGSGHEEFFDAGWYFTRSKDAGIFSGNLHRSYLKGRAAAYRQHLLDPIPFATRLRLEIDHGIDSRLRSDYCSAAYWYETPPAKALPPLPERRRPTRWWPHALQFLALPFVAPVALAAAAPRFLKFLRARKR